jgi:hypothetical protein
MRVFSLPALVTLPIAAALTLAPCAVRAQITLPSDMQTGSGSAALSLTAIVAEAAARFGIPESWIWAVMRVESGGRTHAISPVGAQGLMQIMPATWNRLRARHGLGADPFDAHDNVLAGASYLREMYDRYGSVTAMLAAYNAGPGRYESYAAGARGLPLETKRYVARIAPAIGTPIGGLGVQNSSPRSLPNPHTWMGAALFVRTMASDNFASGQPDRDDQTDRLAAPTQPVSKPLGGVRTDVDPALPRPDRQQGSGLFVRRSVAGQVP